MSIGLTVAASARRAAAARESRCSNQNLCGDTEFCVQPADHSNRERAFAIEDLRNTRSCAQQGF